MPYDSDCRLWPNPSDRFFRDRELRPVSQDGPQCVATSLAILTGADPADFVGKVNTQDPASWSEALAPYGMQLAYCPTDARKLEFYLPELLELDDLFTLSYYTPEDPKEILRDPDERGWICGSHIVVLHRGQILDPSGGTVTDALDHGCGGRHTKRIFRVVPTDCSRRL